MAIMEIGEDQVTRSGVHEGLPTTTKHWESIFAECNRTQKIRSRPTVLQGRIVASSQACCQDHGDADKRFQNFFSTRARPAEYDVIDPAR